MIRHGLALAIVLSVCALVWSENPCERADGSVDASCIANNPQEREDGK